MFFEIGNRINILCILFVMEILVFFLSKRDMIVVCFFCVVLISGVLLFCNSIVKEKVKNINKMYCNIFFLFIFESVRKFLRLEYGNRICLKMCFF